MKKKLAALAFGLVSMAALASPAFAGSVSLVCPSDTHAVITSIVVTIQQDGNSSTTIYYTCVPNG